MRVDLIRHGEPEVRGLLLGRTDISLSERGRQQLAHVAAGRTWASVVTSPLRRAREPAEALAHARGVPLRIDDDWAEMDFGTWDGRAVAELRETPATAAHLATLYQCADAPGPPDGETWMALHARTTRALHALLDTPSQAPALVSTHGGPMRAALSAACGIPYERTWSFRIDYGTRLTLRIARQDDRRLWGEIVELVQP